MTARIVELRQGILKKNDLAAAALRARLHAHGVFTLNLVSSPGAGKTELLTRTLQRLVARGVRVATLVGDLATDHDAARLRAAGAPVQQICTHGLCHLEADMVGAHLDGWDLADLDVLCIENVGNLVCPSSYDLGEDLRVVLLSVPEGEDKPLKYPTIFNSADVALVTKLDLATACAFDADRAAAHLQTVRPGLPTHWTSARSGEGLDRWVEFLLARREAARATRARTAAGASRDVPPGARAHDPTSLARA